MSPALLSVPTSVPDLCLDSLAVNVDAPRRKLDTNSRLGLEVELVTCETRENCVSVASTRVAAGILTVTVDNKQDEKKRGEL